MPTLRGLRVTLRPATDDDVLRFEEILREPEVARWWGEPRVDLHEEDDRVFAIETGGDVVGLLMLWEETDPEYRHAGLDISLATAHQNQGLGTEALRLAARYAFDELGHHRITIDPAAANERAIHVYTRLGFRPVGVMRQYERGADGTWHDGLLMDMLRDELT
jgi:aminoglycoside 6'-N-acetyltransferase